MRFLPLMADDVVPSACPLLPDIPVSAFAAPAIAFEATIWLADIPEPPDKLILVWLAL
ncbi:hypothetical protein G3V92_25280 [Escherichia coli]|nr:hypothetical protein [Escherichia coli]